MAPAWLDFVALLSGFEPPARKEGFAWCELGCGQGVTAAILAATHPEGRFCGIDLMPDHIAGAQRLRERAATANLDLHCLDFAAAAERDLPQFDYIVAHGVYSWVDERSRANLRRFIAGHLASPGLVYISYNAMPGWPSTNRSNICCTASPSTPPAIVSHDTSRPRRRFGGWRMRERYETARLRQRS